MATSIFPQLEVTSFWENVDSALHRRGVHCGLPLGASREKITTEYKALAEIIADIQKIANPDAQVSNVESADNDEWQIHRSWNSSAQWKGRFWSVAIFRHKETGRYKIDAEPIRPVVQRYGFLVNTGAMRAQYTLAKAERMARKRLESELSDVQRDCYMTTDAFVEMGKSGVTYVVRKNRPTIALREDKDGNEILLCALCFHPIAYYTGSWCGVLPPSDEALAHVLMIRSGEKYYWRKAHQIPIEREHSGI